MAVHPPTHLSSELSTEENESEPNFEWAPCEVSAGVQQDLNVLANKIHSSPGENECVTLIMPPCAIDYPMHKTAESAQTLNNVWAGSIDNILTEPVDKRKQPAAGPHRQQHYYKKFVLILQAGQRLNIRKEAPT
jgi:hypothetical protein